MTDDELKAIESRFADDRSDGEAVCARCFRDTQDEDALIAEVRRLLAELADTEERVRIRVASECDLHEREAVVIGIRDAARHLREECAGKWTAQEFAHELDCYAARQASK